MLVTEAIASADRFIEPGKNFAILWRIDRQFLQLSGTVGNQSKQPFVKRWQGYLPDLRHRYVKTVKPTAEPGINRNTVQQTQKKHFLVFSRF